jgi:hypothetical protein
MTILNDILTECSYTAANPFRFTYSRAGEMKSCEAAAYLSLLDRNQVYLLVCVDPLELPELLSGNFMANLAKTFRKQPFHESPMDRNTSLLLICCHSADALPDHESKVRLEDDPYYFKKYVFSYTSASERLATSFLEHKKTECANEFSYVNEVLDYLMNAEEFGKYKDTKDELSTYSYFVELATKIPAFPLNIRNSEQIKSVSEFLSEQLDGKDVNTEHLDFLAFSGLDFNEASVESILAKYDEITTK